MIPEGPLLWHVNRSTGLVLLVLLTTTVMLGVWSTRGDAGTRVPRFAVQALHRNIGLLSMTMLTLHVATAVLDEFVDIRWWQVFAAWDLHYRPLWLALGIVALDLLVVVTVTSLLRDRLPVRGWRLLHLLTYPVWLLSVAHGLGIGTDRGEGWVQLVYLGSAVAVAASVLVRIAGSSRRRRPVPLRAAGPIR